MRWLEIIEGKNNAPQAPWGVSTTPLYEPSVQKLTLTFPDLKEKAKKFTIVKMENPLMAKYGKHDSPFAPGSPLAGFWHAHLRDDAIIIYNLKNRCVNLVCVVTHAEIEGKRVKQTANQIAPYK